MTTATELKVRGRKASAGTHDARDYVNSGKFSALLNLEKGTINQETIDRIIKAVRFGLGIK